MSGAVASGVAVSFPDICRVPAGTAGDAMRALAVRVESALDAAEGEDDVSQSRARSLLVTSIDAVAPIPACQLAAVQARSGRQTCLVDAAIAHGPDGLFLSQQAAGWGLSDWLAKGGDAPVNLVETDAPPLKLLLRGSNEHALADMLRTDQVRQLNAELSRDIDRVVWAGPPLASAAAQAIAGAVDGVVLVVSPGRVTRTAANRARASIAAVRGRLLGIVVADR